MADGESPPWADLPTHIVRGIASRLLCEIDRRRGEGLCYSWRAAFLQLRPPPPPLPRLVVPNASGPAFHCVPSNWRTHPFFMPRFAHHLRYFGSYDGAWLFLSISQAGRHVLLSLTDNNNYKRISLPNTHRRRIPPMVVDQQRIVIVTATLSRQPTEPECVAAGIIGFHSSPYPRNIAFWGMGERSISQSFPPMNQELQVEDLLCSHGAFHFLTRGRGEHIRTFHEPIFPLQDVVTGELYFQSCGDDDSGRPVLARYLVESREKLLMVVRLGTPRPRRSPTSAFRVFQREDRDVINDDGEVQVEHSWTKLPTLDGRMLFVGRGCSRSYEAAHGYPGMEGVSFLDDRSFYDSSIVFRNGAQRRYHCTDIRKYVDIFNR